MSLDGACVSSSINATVIKENALLIHEVRMRQRRQYIYPEMKFSCNGSVIKWIYGAVDQNRATGDLPELQIWRQTGPNSYNKQGSSLVTANISIAPNVYEYYPVTPLEFQEGDNFGVHIPEDEDSKLLLYKQRESGPLNLRIDSDVDSPAPSTINEALRTNVANDFPLVTLEISYDILTTDNSYKSPDMSTSAKIVTTPTTSILITTTFITLDTTTPTITTTTVLITTGDTLIITTTGTLGMIYSLSILYYCLYSLIDTSISLTPSIPVGTPSANTQLLLAVVLSCIIIVVIIFLIIIILVCICLLFTRYKKTLSLYDDVITTTDDPPTSTNPSYVPTSNNLTNNDGSSGTGLYMDINGAYEGVLPPVINIEKNPAYGKCDDDYI